MTLNTSNQSLEPTASRSNIHFIMISFPPCTAPGVPARGGLSSVSLDVIANPRHLRHSRCAFAHSLPTCHQREHLQQHSGLDHSLLAPWSNGDDPVTLSFHVVIPSRAHELCRRPTRRAARLRHSLSRKRVHVSELQIRFADSAERQDLRGAGHDPSESISTAAERLSSCSTRMTLPRQTSNHAMERTADRRENSFSMTKRLHSEASPAFVSGRSSYSR
jgi:hypothetical protein